MKTKNHYENHLSNYYSWIYGGNEENIQKNRQFFEFYKIKPFSSKVAIDLGAGSGFQSIPLSQIGFRVTAVDFCKKLLNEIDKKEFNIEIIEDDILKYQNYSNRNPELIICMGDTITHLPDLDSVIGLIDNSYKELISKGKIILTFRDLTFELKESERFIPVKNDSDKIFTCFLEYHSDYLDVYDIVNEYKNDKWIQKVSTYKKIIISEEEIKTIFHDLGFKIDFYNKEKGMITIIGSKN